MPFFSDQLVHGVLILSLCLFVLSLLLIVFVIGRRIQHEKDFKYLDEFRSRLGVIFAALRDQTVSYDEALGQVRGLFSLRFQVRMEQIFLDHLRVPADVILVKRMAEDLGFVDRWRQCLGLMQRQGSASKREARPALQAARFFTRARNAENLGRIQHDGSWKLLAQLLWDPNADVQRVALRSLAAIGEPESFPALVEHLQNMVTHPGANFPTGIFLPLLRAFLSRVSGHLLPLFCNSNSRIRS